MSEIRKSDSVEPTSLRGFWSLFVTQFQGAFSDNIYRTLAMFLIIGAALPHFKGDSRELRMAVVGALFALPFIIFSMAGGYLADRFSKRTITIGVKVFEIGVMLLALAGLVQQQWLLLLACVFLMGMHSAFFGPSKYGLLPELLPEKKLSWGNGVIELGTFLAIIFGTIGGGWLFETFKGAQWWGGVMLVGLAVFGLFTSFTITPVPAASPTKHFKANFLADLWEQMKFVRKDRVLMLAVVGNTYFFFLGALIQQYTIYAYGKDLLHLNEGQITAWLMPAMAAGIGVGSYAAGHLSGKKIEYGLIPLGSMGMTIFGLYLALPGHSLKQVIYGLALYGFFAGFFIVPIAALIQHRPVKGETGAVIAASNLLSFVGIFLSAGVFFLLGGVFRMNAREVFMVTTAMTLAGTIYAVFLLPDSLLRFVLWILTRTVYRIRVLGRDNIPAKGGALFVCNHVSFVDAVLMLASTDRQVRFMMFKAHYELPYIKPFAKILGVIPISSEQRPREMIKSLQIASDAIRAGEVVCIFAEGQITRTGHLLPFRRGFERIMKEVEAPIIPVGIDGVWGSIFSFDKGRFLWKLPRRIPYPITINYGEALPHTATPLQVRSAVQELLVKAWELRKGRMRSLPIGFVHSARKHPLRFAMADAQNAKVTFASALLRSVFLARRLRKVWTDQKMVGLLLPPSVPGALVNHAALLLGKVPVNLNYTVSEETLASCIRQCEIRTVITSRMFVAKLKLKISCETIFLEDIAGAARKGSAKSEADEQKPAEAKVAVIDSQTAETGARPPGFGEMFVAFAIAFIIPDRWIQKILGAERRTGLDDLATVIFSSGSTGDPKGVMLSHYNIGSNVEQLEQVFGLNYRDRMCGILPFFHSFGFMGTLALPAMLGVGVAYHPNPLDGKTIGQLVRDYEITFLLATPTFLQIYMRGCAAEDFGSLRVVMTGAEKLPDRLAAAFEEQFGLRPLEGYGCTECAPAVAVNTLDFRSAGFRQIGSKRGKIGHPLPGISIRIVDPQSMEPVPFGQPGLMLVRGPNVMQGYLDRPEKTAEVLRDGWYTTGDIAAIDDDGFLQITDRLSRFSKIGGEMVPHIKVEEKLHEVAASTEQTFVVAGVPDEKKGERLIVLHRLSDEKLKAVLEKFAQSELPNLWKPRADQFFRVEAFPYLGTGKLDLRKIKELAASLSGELVASA
jgi:acyl-[acyl-carrier-protein]-phospholipid O-acyltransferase/long-chain-fatty-acid--[acyl-carrier-protein] ligase